MTEICFVLLIHFFSLMRTVIGKFASNKLEYSKKYKELNEQLKKVQNELNEVENKEKLVCKVEKSKEFGGACSTMVNKIFIFFC